MGPIMASGRERVRRKRKRGRENQLVYIGDLRETDRDELAQSCASYGSMIIYVMIEMC